MRERTQQGQARGGRGVEKADGAGLSVESGPAAHLAASSLTTCSGRGQAQLDNPPTHHMRWGGRGAGGRQLPSQGSQEPASITHPSRRAQ
eukprot:3093533-Prymnesium_polylepis.1